MSNDVFPRHYEGWKVCITEKCKIALTQSYVEKRISTLSNKNSPERKSFEEKYGAHWTETVLGYFKQALGEVSN